jgi:excinuclease ABC subunit A
MQSGERNSIRVVGARTHNLKNVSVEIPRDKVVVITGPSGSGKTSLAIDTLSAEAQRQYFESLSIQSRPFFKLLPAADVDMIEGLPPTVFIDQATGYRSRRSTVGTMTEIYDYFRLLFARCGKLHCQGCGQAIERTTIDQIHRWALGLPKRTKIIVLAPLMEAQSGLPGETLDMIRRERLVRVRIDGQIQDIDQVGPLQPSRGHSIDAVTDRLIVRSEMESRLLEAIAMAERLARG